MALRDQPYIPLYVQDIMTDEKLNECSASTHGIYIKGIMCLMHKSENYGTILLKQKYKQTSKQSKNFACQLVKHLPYTIDEISNAIDELISEKVCYFDSDQLCQKRMIKDNKISILRSKSGKKGGDKTGKKFALAKPQANPEYESEIINNNIPTLNEFLEHSKVACKKAKLNYNELSFAIESKYETWVNDGWKDGHGKKIKGWKNKISNTLSFLKPIRQPKKQTDSYGTLN